MDALLERGDLEAWTPLLRTIARDPWGSTAETVPRVCEAHRMYGASVLWPAWIARRRLHTDEPGETLAQARARASAFCCRRPGEPGRIPRLRAHVPVAPPSHHKRAVRGECRTIIPITPVSTWLRNADPLL